MYRSFRHRRNARGIGLMENLIPVTKTKSHFVLIPTVEVYTKEVTMRETQRQPLKTMGRFLKRFDKL